MKLFLDVKASSWIEENGRDIVILSSMGLVALALIVGIWIWIRKRKKRKAR